MPNILLRLTYGFNLANRKKAEARKVVEGAPPSMLTEAEEFSKSKDTGCPVAEPVTPQSASVCIKCNYL